LRSKVVGVSISHSQVLHAPDHSTTEVFGVSTAWGAGGVGLFALDAVVVAPIAEECLFRGVLLPWLTTWMKPLVAIVVSALAFGVGHLYYGTGVLIPVVYGVVLGWMRLRTGRLRAGIALHMLLNAAATGVLLVKMST
jgi:membrane protease YdiL (CAAX protease family)